MYSTERIKDPERRLKAAERHSSFVRGPYDFLSLDPPDAIENELHDG